VGFKLILLRMSYGKKDGSWVGGKWPPSTYADSLTDQYMEISGSVVKHYQLGVRRNTQTGHLKTGTTSDVYQEFHCVVIKPSKITILSKTDVAPQKFCAECGAKFSGGKFCSECGKSSGKLSGVVEQKDAAIALDGFLQQVGPDRSHTLLPSGELVLWGHNELIGELNTRDNANLNNDPLADNALVEVTTNKMTLLMKSIQVTKAGKTVEKITRDDVEIMGGAAQFGAAFAAMQAEKEKNKPKDDDDDDWSD